ncbi:peptide/nickel transport system substrate-binding protein [Caballeronia udeis]|uniref:Peptide/nickel transport system substrate-binding protein n=1 Tax=Caballeronia udeis TaxID=1232866 RepID=A0ABW8N466_9BURK
MEHCRRRIFVAGSTLIAASVLCPLSLRRASAQSSQSLIWGSNLPPTLDPHALYDVPSAFTRVNLYDALFEYDGNPAVLKPVLVDSYKISPDGKVYDFQLKEGVRFHDGGVLSASDVVYSFKRLLTLGTGPAAVFSHVLKPDSLLPTGAHSFRVQLSEPFSPLLDTLTAVAIVNQKLLESKTTNGDWAQDWISKNDAGSGPYRVVDGSFTGLIHLDLAVYPQYFRGWLTKTPINSVLCRPVRDDATRLLAIEKGDIDATNTNLRPDQQDRLLNAPNVELVKGAGKRLFLFRMHNGRAPLNNVNFRKALACAFPYDLYISRIMRGQVDRNPGPLLQGMWGYPPNLEGYKYDLGRARQYLEKAKAEGADITREINFLALVGFDETVQAAQLLQSELRKIGVTLTISKAVWANASQRIKQEQTSPDIWAHWMSAYYLDPDNYFGQMYSQAAIGTDLGSSWYRDEQTDALIVRARRLLDKTQRKSLYETISNRLVDQCVDIWIYNGSATRAIRKRVKGYQSGLIGDSVPLRAMYLQT